MKNIKISKRLLAAAELCRQGSFIADVGTDHAYLPIYLANEGKIRGGVVSDINKGPIERATKNIGEWGLRNKLTPILCDGLTEIAEYDPEDIFILGMGGELIAEIIDKAEFVRKSGVRLILQPMTHSEILRKYLLDNGFEIVDEKLVKEEKIYRIILAEYTGATLTYNQIELLLGKKNIEKKEPLFYELLEHTERVLGARIEGKERSDADAAEEKYLLKEIGKLK